VVTTAAAIMVAVFFLDLRHLVASRVQDFRLAMSVASCSTHHRPAACFCPWPWAGLSLAGERIWPQKPRGVPATASGDPAAPSPVAAR